MKKAAVVIDEWKLSIFTKILDNAGFKYEQFKGPTLDCITLKVQTETIAKLQPFVAKANAKAAKSKAH
ncbi:MAG: hypothetical protein JKY52_19835 [Flavobacteriales bacterium]|nr:hypothetical protein [Flavobacteriales bacterium]